MTSPAAISGRALSVRLPGAEAGAANIESDMTDVPTEYYNLQGIRIDRPETGIYIRRQGQNVTKVIVH